MHELPRAKQNIDKQNNNHEIERPSTSSCGNSIECNDSVKERYSIDTFKMTKWNFDKKIGN